jgi:hypothetical protein
MCMFCAAVPAVAVVTGAAAQREKRRQLAQGETTNVEPASPRPEPGRLTPMRISQCGALAIVGLLIGSAFYHTHFPG